jgi:SOS-response transcriptional repressor LexA
MIHRNDEWERDAVVWLAGRRIEAGPAPARPDDPRLARARAGFDAWRESAEREADAARFAALVRRRVAVEGRGVRRVEGAPELVRPAVAGALAPMIAAAREAHAAPLAELGVAAGTGRELFDEPCDLWVALPADLGPGRYVALRVVGDSMVPMLHSGDLVLVDLDGAVHPGSVAVARHPEHGYVVKQVRRRGERALSLVSLNEAYPPLELPAGPGALLGPVVLRWCWHGPAKPGLARGT